MPEQTNKKQSSKKPEGPPRPVRQQLALDIEAGGGIHIFDKGKTQALDELLNNKQGGRDKIFGKYGRGTTERRQLRNLVQRWKK